MIMKQEQIGGRRDGRTRSRGGGLERYRPNGKPEKRSRRLIEHGLKRCSGGVREFTLR